MSSQPHPPTPADRQGLVVDLEHLDFVSAQLSKLEVRFTGPAEHPELAHHGLGLALLVGLREGPFESYETPALVSDLDGLMYELRSRIGDGRGGWTPVIGKNRDIDGVIRVGTSKPMGYTDPMTSLPHPSEAEPAVTATAEAGSGVRIGVLDTPLYLHSSFNPDKVRADREFVAPTSGSVHPSAGHSTFVVSRILRQAPAADISVRAVLGSATGRGNAWDTAVALLELAQSVDIINLSLACFTTDGQPPLVIRRAIERLSPDVLVVAAAGNHADQTGLQHGRTARSPAWPAALGSVVAVGATNVGGFAAPFSPQTTWVDCTARGVNVEGAYLSSAVHVHEPLMGMLTGVKVDLPFTGSAVWSGTSFAAATVSGAVAARMTGGVTARQALRELLDDQGLNSVVKAHREPSCLPLCVTILPW